MSVPKHIAIIMDGNGRWAKRRGMPRTFGHRKGIERLKNIIPIAHKLGIKILTLFAFSTENWNRPRSEIDMLFRYLESFLSKDIEKLHRDGVKLNVIGRKNRFDRKLLAKIKQAQEMTKLNKNFILNIALDYGSRYEIVEAVKKIVKDCLAGKIEGKDINEELFSHYLYTSGISDPDLLIRTSGEQRISNFLLWQLSYTELYFPKVHWPDFGKKELEKAIAEYNKRERRFGAVRNQ